MALFFDKEWFDARLATAGLSRSDVATALGLSAIQIEDLWKDQREFKANDVRILAALIGAEPKEVAVRAGISTPVPSQGMGEPGAVAEQLTRIEALLTEIRALLLALGSK
jgi:hypothetical protein